MRGLILFILAFQLAMPVSAQQPILPPSKEDEAPKPTISLDLFFNLVVHQTGTQTSRGGGPMSPHRGSATYQRHIDNWLLQRIRIKKDLDGDSVLKLESKAEPNARNSDQANQMIEEQEEIEAQKEADKAKPSNGQNKVAAGPNFSIFNRWRKVDISTKWTGNESKRRASISVVDVIHGERTQFENPKWFYWNGDQKAVVDRALVDGTISIRYPVPKGVKFVKVIVPKGTASGMFTNINPDDGKVSLIGSVHSRVEYLRPSYAWLKIDEKTLPKDRVLTLQFSYNAAMPDSATISGQTFTSNFIVEFETLKSSQSGLPLNQRLSSLPNFLNEVPKDDDAVILELANLIESKSSLASALRSLSMSDAQQILDALVTHSLQINILGRAIHPFEKALTSILVYLISNDLSKELLPYCKAETFKMKVTGREVREARYLFLSYYLSRAAHRYMNYEAEKYFAFVEALSTYADSEITYQQLSSDKTAMEILRRSYNFYNIVQGEVEDPMGTAHGELIQFGKFMNMAADSYQANDFAIVLDLAKRASALEDSIQNAIAESRLAVGGQNATRKVNVTSMKSQRRQLDATVKEMRSILDEFASVHLMMNLENIGTDTFSKSLFSIFEGLSLVSSQGVDLKDAERLSYFYPIYEYEFSEEQQGAFDSIVAQSQACMEGGKL